MLWQVGKWIAQWDAPYEAWYYYNSESGEASPVIHVKNVVILMIHVVLMLRCCRRVHVDQAGGVGGH